jgi:mannose-6-phosphate isomerase
MVEVMEPIDFVARVEFIAGDRVIPESARFMDRDVNFALDMFSLDSWPVEAVQARWRCQPKVLEENSLMCRESLVDQRLTDRFRIARTILTGPHMWKSRGFTVLIVLEGSCSVLTELEELRLSKYDRIIVPHGLQTLEICPQNTAVLLESSSQNVDRDIGESRLSSSGWPEAFSEVRLSTHSILPPELLS